MPGVKKNLLTPAQEQVLRARPITPDAPGTVLHDFDVLLRFIGINGIQTAGELRLLPISALAELNSTMRQPLRVNINRGQLRSYPNLSVLHVLGRASGLVMLQGSGSETRLAIDPELLAQWLEFNPVERYCTLLEAWLLRGRPEMIGQFSGIDNFLNRALECWRRIPKGGRKFSLSQRGSDYGLKEIDYDRYNFGFLWLFGLVEVEQGEPLPKKAWCPVAVRRTAFGDALLTLLANAPLPRFTDGGGFFLLDSEPASQENDADDGTTEKPVSLNELQPILTPYFAGWHRALTIPPPQFRDGVYVFKVSMRSGKIWRRIAIPANLGWRQFANAILDSVKFDDDHLWQFTWTDRFGAKLEINSDEPLEFSPNASLGADEAEIGGIPLRLGEPFEFLFDFGDNWKFEITLERIDPPDPKLKRPKVIESHGKAPTQYPNEWE